MIKRIFDISLAIVGFFLALPLLVLIALIHVITMPGSLFYLQTRTGYKGKHFTIFKFRTMVINKDDIVITVDSDKRITTFGQILRATKFDELPQLWNILKGDMSFVGPRPDVPGYYDELTGDDRIVLEVRPGLTGADSIAYTYEEFILGRQEDPVKFYNEKLFPDKVRINKAYVLNRSFKLDIIILLYTLLGRQLKGENFMPRYK
jgi:lipopolysaccharide/colanic/teichoic acid biosynthesis glycosyltransferase